MMLLQSDTYQKKREKHGNKNISSFPEKRQVGFSMFGSNFNKIKADIVKLYHNGLSQKCSPGCFLKFQERSVFPWIRHQIR